MQAIEEKLNSNPNSSWKLFNGFIELINKKQAGNFRISLPNLSLKIKIPAYKDCKQIFSLYEDFFIRAMASRSKKKSGTNLIIWTIVKFAEINVLTIEQLVKFSYFNKFNLIFWWKKTNEHWIFLSSLFPCFSVEKMQMRWFAVQKSVEQKYPWSEKEDQSLVSLIRFFKI